MPVVSAPSPLQMILNVSLSSPGSPVFKILISVGLCVES